MESEKTNVVVVSSDIAEMVDDLNRIITEKNANIPTTFALAFHVLGVAIKDMSELPDDCYDDTRADVMQLLDAIVGYNDRVTTIH